MKKLLSLIVIAAVPVITNAEVRFTAKIYEKDSDKTALYDYKSEFEKNADGGEFVTNTFTNPAGEVQLIEKMEKDGKGRVTMYSQDQKQLGWNGIVTVKGGKAEFKLTKDGKTKTSDEEVGDDFIAGPNLLPEMVSHWDQLSRGETMKRRVPVLDRMETIGFNFFKEDEKTIQGTKAMVFKMKPSSFIIAAVVSPLHFYVNPANKHILRFYGRTQVRKKVGDSWKELDGVTIYTYPDDPAAQVAGGNSK